jgi:ubiquinone/menaquinone biosynthesis C-methylase UbiE
MDHADHVRLLRGGVTPGGTWADLGAGTGAFTLALAELVGPDGEVIAVDRDRGALRDLARALRPGGATVRSLAADFTKPIDLASLDGVVMANSLHFVKDKVPVLALVHHMLKPFGRLLLVEYDADRGNAWVPHPMSFDTWRDLADANGFSDTRKLASVPSRFLGRIYSAVSEAETK